MAAVIWVAAVTDLHDGFGDGVFQPQLSHCIHKPLVQLCCPHKARPFEGPRLIIVAIFWV